jgi:chorismate synthase
VTRDGREVELRGKGRHDPCVLPRAVPMVEAMMALTLVDNIMMQKAQCELLSNEAGLDDRPNPLGKTATRSHVRIRHPVEITGSTPLSQRVDEE